VPEQPWYAEFFGESYLRLYRPYLTPQRTEREVIGVVQRLVLPEGSKILDLACGYGRHSIPLAFLGYQVTGLDLSAELLAQAEAMAQDVDASVRWVQADMRAIPFEGEFQAVINLFTAYGYLESEHEDARVLRSVQRALAPGGVFLLDTVNRESLIRHFMPAEVERHDDGLMVIQEQDFDLRTSRMNVQVTLIEQRNRRKTYRQSIRIYTLTEVAAMLGEAGLSLEGIYGDLDGSPLTLESRRLVVLARKAAYAGCSAAIQSEWRPR
jgi:SAM-dependent methyltransferase